MTKTETGYRPEIERDMDGGFGNRGTRMENRPHRGLLSKYANGEMVAEGQIRTALRQRSAPRVGSVD